MRCTVQPAVHSVRVANRSRSVLRASFAFQNARFPADIAALRFALVEMSGIFVAALREAEHRVSSGMLDWSTCKSVERVPGRVSGAWVFKGTRLPVRSLFENIEAGATVDQFLAWYEGVTREQVLEVLRHAEQSLAAA